MLSKSSTPQDCSGQYLISCAGVSVIWEMLSRAQSGVEWLALSILQGRSSMHVQDWVSDWLRVLVHAQQSTSSQHLMCTL